MPMKYAELRKVRVTLDELAFTDNDGPTVFEGRFHEWGYELAMNKERISVAIVEDEDGRIHTVLPAEVQFLDSRN